MPPWIDTSDPIGGLQTAANDITSGGKDLVDDSIGAGQDAWNWTWGGLGSSADSALSGPVNFVDKGLGWGATAIEKAGEGLNERKEQAGEEKTKRTVAMWAALGAVGLGAAFAFGGD